jgi:hypothetical protein
VHLLSYPHCIIYNSNIIMRFSVVSPVPLSKTQVTYGASKKSTAKKRGRRSRRSEITTDTDQCNGDTVTYRQPVEGKPGRCPNAYEYIHVYMDGAGVDLSDSQQVGAKVQRRIQVFASTRQYNCSKSCSPSMISKLGTNVGLQCKQNRSCLSRSISIP